MVFEFLWTGVIKKHYINFEDFFMNQEQDLDQLRLEIVKKIENLQKREASCGELNSEFIKLGFESTNAFKHLIARVRKTDSGDVKKTLLGAKQAVDKLLLKHVAFNNKRTYFYDVSTNNLKKIYENIQKENQFFLLGESHKNFNYDEIDHEKIETSLILDDNDFKVVYLKTGRNRVETRFIADGADLFEQEHGKVVEVRIKVQYEMNAFDFIAFDFKNEKLIIGADLDKLFPKPETEKAIDRLQIAVRKLAGLQELKNRNLRNCVENLELEESGIVLNHAFMTAEGGYNHAGNSITNKQDVRKDDFHADGIKDKEADYYGIIKAYELSDEETVVITIRMTFRDYKKLNLPIRFAILDGVTSLNGLKFAIRKVIEHNHN